MEYINIILGKSGIFKLKRNITKEDTIIACSYLSFGSQNTKNINLMNVARQREREREQK